MTNKNLLGVGVLEPKIFKLNFISENKRRFNADGKLENENGDIVAENVEWYNTDNQDIHYK